MRYKAEDIVVINYESYADVIYVGFLRTKEQTT